jgi:peptidoglycan/xylan/chitin deacetylase (PgdA/CDA1 family)
MYHRIDEILSAEDSYYGLTTTPAEFEAQMGYLAQRGFEALSLNDVLRCERRQIQPPRRPIAITFDDGYLDNYFKAWPILQKYSFTATIFLVAERIGQANDWDHEVSGNWRLMSVEQIREMQQRGIAFGSHTLTHVSLVDLDPDEAFRQIHNSKQLLESLLEHPIEFFSYPYDRLNATVMEMVAQSGYAGACGASTLPFNPYNMWRNECLGTDSMTQFRLKSSGLYNHLMWLRDQTIVGQIGLKLKDIVR